MEADRTREAAEQFVIDLQAAALSRQVYSEDHPRSQKSLAQALTALSVLLQNKTDMTLAVVGGTFAFERFVLHRATKVAGPLIDSWNACALERLTFHWGLTEDEFSRFVALLSQHHGDIAEAGFKHISAGRLAVGGAHTETDALPEALRERVAEAAATFDHEDGMRTLRKVAKSLHRDAHIDVDAVQAAVGKVLMRMTENRDSVLVSVTLRRHDEYSFVHSVNVAMLSLILAEGIGLRGEALSEIGMAGLLHDAGKLAVEGDILRKKGRLTDEEREDVQSHPLEGARLLAQTPDLSPMVVAAAFEHHLRYDGGGYPNLVFGSQLTLPGMIVAVADVYEALRATRSYRVGMAPEDAYAEMAKMAGNFHPELFETFFRLVGVYPPGTIVALDDGSVGMVRKSNPDHIEQPQVEILSRAGGVRPREPQWLDLAAVGVCQRIVRSLDPDKGYDRLADRRAVA